MYCTHVSVAVGGYQTRVLSEKQQAHIILLRQRLPLQFHKRLEVSAQNQMASVYRKWIGI